MKMRKVRREGKAEVIRRVNSEVHIFLEKHNVRYRMMSIRETVEYKPWNSIAVTSRPLLTRMFCYYSEENLNPPAAL